MANKGRFTIDGIIWDSILSVVAEDSNHNVLYRMPDVSDGTVEVNADSKDSTDKNGATIKKGYTAKSCSVTLTNTHLVLGAYAGTTGSDKVVATSESKQDTPRMMLIDPANKDVKEEIAAVKYGQEIADPTIKENMETVIAQGEAVMNAIAKQYLVADAENTESNSTDSAESDAEKE